ncbi:MAG: HAD family hydrolase [Terriglobales bacterium]
MKFLAIATDYDGTLAANGRPDTAAMAALQRAASAGCKLVLVTGRVVQDLQSVFPGLTQFDRVVAENGAIMYNPASGEQTLLCEPVPRNFVAALRQRGLPVATGRAIVATHAAHTSAVEEVIRQLGLELQIVRNKNSAMILPAGVDKASGVQRALGELGIAAENAVAIGDAENDEALLQACGFGVAVANALPTLKARADLVTQGAAGAGVAEAIASIFGQ